MVLDPKQTTVAYRCPSCGAGVLSVVGLFNLGADMVKLKCDCGKSEMTMVMTSDKKVRFTVPCILCPKPHNFTVSSNIFFNKELFVLPCPYSDINIAMMGEVNHVKAELSRTELELLDLLEKSGIDISGKECVVIGRSNIVGKPMAMLLLQANGTVTICHSRTKDLAEVTRRADILVVAIGKADFVTADMVKPGAVVIDVGMNRRADGKLTGDVDFESVSPVASYITPVPGGVGPMTITMLLKNTLVAAENFAKDN
jgi:hypothetical protein